MYSQQDLDDAVASGVITIEAANALRAHIEAQRSTVIPDEEQFRLLTGFNDIFVSIAAAILLFAVGWIGQSIGQSAGLILDVNGPSPLAPLAVAATAWPLAIFFTGKRRMALPSILLLLAFVGGVLATAAFTLVSAIGPDRLDNNTPLASPPSTFCQEKVVTSTFAQSIGWAKMAEVASVNVSPPRLAGIRSKRRMSSSVSCSSLASGSSCSQCGGIRRTARG